MTLRKQGDFTGVNKIPSKYLLNADFDFELANKMKKSNFNKRLSIIDYLDGL